MEMTFTCDGVTTCRVGRLSGDGDMFIAGFYKINTNDKQPVLNEKQPVLNDKQLARNNK